MKQRVVDGASYEEFIVELKGLGVSFYIYNIKSMTTMYYGVDGNFVFEPLRISDVVVSDVADADRISCFLSENPRGSILFEQFTRDCASLGVCFWKTDLVLNKISYFDVYDRLVYTVDIM